MKTIVIRSLKTLGVSVFYAGLFGLVAFFGHVIATMRSSDDHSRILPNSVSIPTASADEPGDSDYPTDNCQGGDGGGDGGGDCSN